MDLSLYLIDLLTQQGQVTVPGLGRFSNVRASAYYNEDEGKFYPPYNTIQYDQQYDTDAAFAEHISQKKGISVQSASFFIDKYVDGLLQEVATNDAEIADLGWLRYDGIKITFKLKNAISNNPEFFGLPAFELHKIGQQPPAKDPIPDLSFSFSPTAPAQKTTTQTAFGTEDPTTVSTPTKQQYVDDDAYDYEPKRRLGTWAIAAIGLLVIGAAVTGVYFYKPSLLGLQPKESKPLVNVPADSLIKDTTLQSEPVPVNDVVVGEDNSTTIIQGKTGVINTDTTNLIPETTTQILDQPASTDNRTRWEIQAGFYASEKKANDYLSLFTKRGLDARVVPGKGTKFIITLGTYYNRNEASAARQELIGAEKIKKSETYIQDYPPVKK